MNQFNKKLDQAKIRQRKVYLVAGITGLAILLVTVALFIISRGTRIEVTPLDAKEQAVFRIDKGIAFCAGDTVYSFVGNPVITAFSPGFKAARVSIDSQYLGRVFPLELSELPGHLTAEVSGKNDLLLKTAWQVNDRHMAISDKLDLELEPGRYTLIADNPFFQSKEMAVEIKRGEQTLIQVALLPVKGFFNISSKPSGATVFLDNNRVGSTPLQFDRHGGQYNLQVVLKDYIEAVEQVSLTRANPKVSRNYNLELQKGRVRIRLVPKGGTLLVDGIKKQEPLILDATVKHRLTYMKAGFYSETQFLKLAAGEEKHIVFQLKPETGMVEISSLPPAAVQIDGKAVGQSPLSIELSAVVHTIEFKKPGYRSVVKTIKPKGGSVKKVSVSLRTEYQARLKEARREHTNTAGVKLKLFLVKDILTMGASRSDKGQRANEFLRTTHLTKPFYASVTEITNRQFAKFTPKRAVGLSNMPVTSVSWQEAAAFCNWLSEKEKIVPFYKINQGVVTGFNMHTDGYRLLSEAEWEWLARKSGKTKLTLFTWGNDTVIPPKSANIADESAKGQVKFFVPNYNDGYSGAAPVKSFDTEPSGLYDMAGNVSEWVHDVYSIVPPQADTITRNPLGDQRGHAHVVKGANWRSGTLTTLRPAFREGLTTGRDDLGFRIGRYLYGGKNE